VSGSVQPLYFRCFGAGPALVLLHGLGLSGEMFRPLWDRLAAHHRLLIPDLRGMGQSAHLPGPYTVEQLAADVAGLLEAQGLASADVLGVSQGGVVAQQLARRYPTRVRRLVLVCTYAFNLASPRERLEARLTPWLIRALGPAGLARLVVRPGLFGGAPMTPAQVRLLRRLLAANRKAQLLAAHRALTDFDSRPWLHQIHQPTLIVCGSQDRAVPGWHAQELARDIEGAELRELQGAGHALIYTHTQQFVELLEAWLAEPPPPAGSPHPPSGRRAGSLG
jgi:pimeloyl-ACP methyl ester carboxylesterase